MVTNELQFLERENQRIRENQRMSMRNLCFEFLWSENGRGSVRGLPGDVIVLAAEHCKHSPEAIFHYLILAAQILEQLLVILGTGTETPSECERAKPCHLDIARLDADCNQHGVLLVLSQLNLSCVRSRKVRQSSRGVSFGKVVWSRAQNTYR